MVFVSDPTNKLQDSNSVDSTKDRAKDTRTSFQGHAPYTSDLNVGAFSYNRSQTTSSELSGDAQLVMRMEGPSIFGFAMRERQQLQAASTPSIVSKFLTFVGLGAFTKQGEAEITQKLMEMTLSSAQKEALARVRVRVSELTASIESKGAGTSPGISSDGTVSRESPSAVRQSYLDDRVRVRP